jgi:hypothetical protein
MKSKIPKGVVKKTNANDENNNNNRSFFNNLNTNNIYIDPYFKKL